MPWDLAEVQSQLMKGPDAVDCCVDCCVGHNYEQVQENTTGGKAAEWHEKLQRQEPAGWCVNAIDAWSSWKCGFHCGGWLKYVGVWLAATLLLSECDAEWRQPGARSQTAEVSLSCPARGFALTHFIYDQTTRRVITQLQRHQSKWHQALQPLCSARAHLMRPVRTIQ